MQRLEFGRIFYVLRSNEPAFFLMYNLLFLVLNSNILISPLRF